MTIKEVTFLWQIMISLFILAYAIYRICKVEPVKNKQGEKSTKT